MMVLVLSKKDILDLIRKKELNKSGIKLIIERKKEPEKIETYVHSFKNDNEIDF